MAACDSRSYEYGKDRESRNNQCTIPCARTTGPYTIVFISISCSDLCRTVRVNGWVGWLVGWVVGWLVGGLVGWVVSWLVG